MLLTQNREVGRGTLASNVLTDLSKSFGLPNSSYFDGSYRDPNGSEAYSMLPVVRSPYHEATDVTTGTGTRAIDENTPIGELSQKSADNGRAADIEVVSLAKGALEFVVTNQFGSVIKVGDTVTYVNGDATVADGTLVTMAESTGAIRKFCAT